MTMQTVNDKTVLGKVLKELQGLSFALVTGAAAGTKMNVAALRTEDTVRMALVFTTAGAVFSDDTANTTIQSVKASGTLTISGNPVADETFVVNGVTYTWKAAANVASVTHVPITAGDNTAMAASVAKAVNDNENRWLGNKQNVAAVVATSALGVVTFTAVVEGTAGNSITLTEASTNVAVSGAGTLAGGTATGGFTSTTNLTGTQVLLVYFNKR